MVLSSARAATGAISITAPRMMLPRKCSLMAFFLPMLPPLRSPGFPLPLPKGAGPPLTLLNLSILIIARDYLLAACRTGMGSWDEPTRHPPDDPPLWAYIAAVRGHRQAGAVVIRSARRPSQVTAVRSKPGMSILP